MLLALTFTIAFIDCKFLQSGDTATTVYHAGQRAVFDATKQEETLTQLLGNHVSPDHALAKDIKPRLLRFWRWQKVIATMGWTRQKKRQKMASSEGDLYIRYPQKFLGFMPPSSLAVIHVYLYASQCFRDGPCHHICLKFNAIESNENWTGDTWDVVGKHGMWVLDVGYTQLASQCIKVGYFRFWDEKVEKITNKTSKLLFFLTL